VPAGVLLAEDRDLVSYVSTVNGLPARFPRSDIHLRLAGFGGYGVDDESPELPPFRQFTDRAKEDEDPTEGPLAVNSFRPWIDDGEWCQDNLYTEHVHRPGDSGGPLYLGNPDVEDIRVFGVVRGSWTSPNMESEFGCTMGVTQSNFIRPFLTSTVANAYLGPLDLPVLGSPERRYHADMELDPDGDGLVDSHDNCVAIYNPNQLDTDADGIGEVEITLPGTSTPQMVPCIDADADGIIDTVPDGGSTVRLDNCLPAECAVPGCASDPDQSDCDGDGLGDACEPDTDGDGVPDDCDNCLEQPNPTQTNCNLEGEIASEIFTPVGDACDPNACPETLTTRAFDFAGGDRTSTNEVFESLGVAIDDGKGTAYTGYRWCNCPVNMDTPEARIICADAPWVCTINHEEYGEAESRWKTMNLTFVTATNVNGANEQALDYREPYDLIGARSDEELVRWDFVPDATALGVLQSDSPVSEYVEAVIWSRPATYADETGVPGGCVGGGCPSTEDNLHSHYWSGRIRRSTHPVELPDWADHMIWSFAPAIQPDIACPECVGFPAAFLGAYCPGGLCTAGAPFEDVAFDLSDYVDPLLPEIASLGSAYSFISPSRPIEMLEPAAHRGFFVTKDGDIAMIVAPEGPGLEAVGSAAVSDMAELEGERWLLAANEGVAYAIGGIDGAENPSAAIRRVDLHTGEVTLVAVHGDRPAHTIAGALHTFDEVALILDIDPASLEYRLVRLDLRRGAALELGRFLPSGEMIDHSLASVPDGSFALAATVSTSDEHRIIRFGITSGGGLFPIEHTSGSGVLAGSLVSCSRGLSLPLAIGPGERFVPAGYRYHQLLPDAQMADLDGLF
jgi:hypothetical protein